MKFVAFFAHWQYDIPRLSESVDNFDGTWNLFPLSNVTCGNHLAWSPLIRYWKVPIFIFGHISHFSKGL